MAPAALCPSPLEIILGQLRRFLAALAAEVNAHRKAATDRETVNRQAEQLLTDYGNSILRLAYSYLHNMGMESTVIHCLFPPAFRRKIGTQSVRQYNASSFPCLHCQLSSRSSCHLGYFP